MTPRPASPLDRQYCPRCHAAMNAVSQVDEVLKKPAVGDLVVCITCAGLLTVTNVGSLRELRDAEYRQLAPSQLLQVAEMQRRVAAGEFRGGRLVQTRTQ